MSQSVSHDVEVLPLGAAADVVHLAGAPALEDAPDRRAVVADVQPVAHVAAVAVHRQRLAGERVEDHERDQLLRELARAVVVRAVRRDDRQAVGVMVGADEVIGGGLRRRVRAVRRVRRGFAERGVRRARATRRPRRWTRAGSGTPASRLRPAPCQWARAASSRLKVPTTFVWMKSAGAWIERSTWLSAAKCTTARGRCSPKRRSTASRSQMSARTRRYRASPSSAARFSVLPAYVSLSRFTTGSPPCASQSRMKFEPMKPAPPVTRIIAARIPWGRLRDVREARRAVNFLAFVARAPNRASRRTLAGSRPKSPPGKARGSARGATVRGRFSYHHEDLARRSQKSSRTSV